MVGSTPAYLTKKCSLINIPSLYVILYASSGVTSSPSGKLTISVSKNTTLPPTVHFKPSDLKISACNESSKPLFWISPRFPNILPTPAS